MKLSIVLPVYNIEEYLDYSLMSLTKQVGDNIEIILIDDGSTDGSFKKMKEWKSKDERIIIASKVNEGSGYARNYGLKMSQGEYIYFMDPDDWVEDNFFEKILSVISSEKVQMIGFGYNIYKQNKIIKTVKSEYTFSINEKKLSTDSFNKIFNSVSLFEVWNKIYNRDFLIKNQLEFTNMKNGQDAYFNIEVAQRISNVLILNETFYNYYASREDSSQNSYYSYEKFKNNVAIAEKYEDLYRTYNSLECKPSTYWINIFFKSIKQNINDNITEIWDEELFFEKVKKLKIKNINHRNSKIKLFILKYLPKKIFKFL